MKNVKVKDICGDFCTKRNNKGIDILKEDLQKVFNTSKKISMDFSDIKIMSVSFIDELFCQLMVNNKIPFEDLNKYVEFKPALDLLYMEQIERGIKLRS